MDIKKVKAVLMLWGIIFSLFATFVLYCSFLVIFLNHPEGYTITINDYNERFIEMIIFSISIVAAIIGQILFFKGNRKQIREIVLPEFTKK